MSLLDWVRPSRALRRGVQKLLEIATGVHYEGPEPPGRRIEERVQLFCLFNPQATAEQWRVFARQLAQNCYREGWVRGYEWLERGWSGPAVDPERLTELEAHDWSLAEQHPDWRRMLNLGYDPRSPLANLSPEQRRAVVDLFQGSTPVVIDFTPYEGTDDKAHDPE